MNMNNSFKQTLSEIKNNMKAIIPQIGKYYYPDYNDGREVYYPVAKQMVKEDDLFYIFSDKSKHWKDMDFHWIEVPPPPNVVISDKPFIFKYEDYSLWSRQLAEQMSKSEIEKELNIYISNTDKYATSHLNAIKATHSMTSNSQRRAQTGNVVRANYERKRAYSNALEIYEYYPDKCYEARFSSTEP